MILSDRKPRGPEIKVKRIMVATDFSAAGDLAVQEAAVWAERFGSAIRVVHVAPPKRWLGSIWGAGSTDIAAIYRHAADALRHASERVQVSGRVEVSTALLSGRASREILRAADDFKSDLLVIGAYGERGRMTKGPTLGGTAAKLARLARLLDQVRGNRSVDNAQHLPHDRRPSGEQKP